MNFALDHELVIVQVTIVGSNAEVVAHILAAQTLLAGHQSLKQLLAVTSANNVCAGIAEQLLDSFCQITNGRSVRLLDEQVTRIAMLEGKHNKIHSLVQIHQESSHVGVSDSDRVADLDLVDEQRDNTAAAAHNIAVAGAADSRAAALSSHTGVGKDDVLHHSLGDAHGIDRIGCLIGRQADNALDTSFDGSMQDIVRANDVSLNSLHWEEFAGRDLLQCSGMENVVNTRHSVLDGLRIADITDIELDFLSRFWVLSLKLMAHIILLFLIARENADFLEVRIKEVFQNSRAKRTRTTSNHKSCVIKRRHFNIPPN